MSKVKFIHTADWQLGKPFAGVEDISKRALLQNQRIEVIRRIGQIAKEQKCEFVLVAGDLFDSPTATKSTVSAACSAIGGIGLPVYVIPGNHDHGGQGSIWEQSFFINHRNELAPNMHVLLKQEPFETEKAIILPCPLLRRHESGDVTDWARVFDYSMFKNNQKPRIILAHGSVETFGTTDDDEEVAGNTVNYINWQLLPDIEFDYIALGDWHGTKKTSDKVWYSGTPELDRFIKSDEHNPGNVLIVTAERNQKPEVDIYPTGGIKWHDLKFHFGNDSEMKIFEQSLEQLIGKWANADLLKLELDGFLGMKAFTDLETRIESLSARLIRLKLINKTNINPSKEELELLTQRTTDPLVANVAIRLTKILENGSNASSEQARMALRKLFSICNK